MQEEMTRAGQLAQLGRELAAVHRFEAALDKLHAALAINNELIGELGRALGTAHRDEGDHAMRRQGYAAAATAYEKALRYAPRLADEIERPYVIARLHLLSDVLKAHRWEAAKEEIDDLLTFAPTSPPVRLCAGDVAAQTGKLQRAAKHYATGLDTRPPHRASREDVIALRERLLERVKSPPAEPAPARTTRTAQTLETAHFVVQHHNSEIGRQVAETAEFHFARITELLDVAPEDLWQEPCKIVVHATQDDYTRATGQAGWSGGVSKIESYAGRLKKQQIASWQTSPELLKSVLPHEITHLVMAAALKYDTKVPLALHEGVAVLMEPQFRGQYYDQMLNLRLGKAGLPPLSELFTHGQYPGDHELFYAQSASLVGYLADEGGLGNLVGFYRSVARDGLRPSLQRHYGVESLDDLEKRWLEALREEKP
jgi:tetratricopeptide (TPR) repeat protein